MVGPAGSGKTTLVRQWLSRRRTPWSWISVDRPSDGPWGIAELVVLALQQIHAPGPLDAVDAISMGPRDTLLRAVVDELGDEPAETPAILVIDGAHHLDPHEWEQLSWFLAHAPASVHPVVICRFDPPMALGRERASGHLAEVRGDQLVFDLDETRRLVGAALGVEETDAVARLHAQTQGWAVGLRLALLACDDTADLDAVLAHFDGTHVTVAEYLLEEVLDRLPAATRDFVLATAIAPVLDADLATALTGVDDAHDLLERLAFDGVFVTAAQGGPPEYRFHPMLADLLQQELRLLDPDRFRAQHLRAADWHLADGEPIDAVDHLLAAHEFERAHRLVLDHFAALYRGAHRPDLSRWVQAVPDDVIAASLDRALEHCRALALLAEPAARPWYRHCDARVPQEGDDRRAQLLMLMSLHHGISGDLGELRSSRDEARRRSPEGATDPVAEIVASWEVRLETHLGDPELAVDLARDLLAAERSLLDDAPAYSALAGALDAAGRTEEAVAVALMAIETWHQAGEPDLPAMTDALVVAARDRRRSGHLDDAEGLLAPALALTADDKAPNLLGALATMEAAAVDRARGRAGWRRRLFALAEGLRTVHAPSTFVARVEAEAGATNLPRACTEVPTVPTSGEPLSERELTILRAMASHLTFPEIGRELHISRHTVKSHAQHIYRKLDAQSRSQAVATARRLGLLPPSG